MAFCESFWGNGKIKVRSSYINGICMVNGIVMIKIKTYIVHQFVIKVPVKNL